jgi:hypothetical protein
VAKVSRRRFQAGGDGVSLLRNMELFDEEDEVDGYQEEDEKDVLNSDVVKGLIDAKRMQTRLNPCDNKRKKRKEAWVLYW